jgi:hypothetical protein
MPMDDLGIAAGDAGEPTIGAADCSSAATDRRRANQAIRAPDFACRPFDLPQTGGPL